MLRFFIGSRLVLERDLHFYDGLNLLSVSALGGAELETAKRLKFILILAGKNVILKERIKVKINSIIVWKLQKI